MGNNATALILVLHGSPMAFSADPVKKMAKVLQGAVDFPNTMLAYLECNEPGIEQAVRQCVADGAERIILVPYLLHRGRHLVLDVPERIQAVAVEFPAVEILLAPPVGESSFVTRALYQRIERVEGAR